MRLQTNMLLVIFLLMSCKHSGLTQLKGTGILSKDAAEIIGCRALPTVADNGTNKGQRVVEWRRCTDDDIIKVNDQIQQKKRLPSDGLRLDDCSIESAKPVPLDAYIASLGIYFEPKGVAQVRVDLATEQALLTRTEKSINEAKARGDNPERLLRDLENSRTIIASKQAELGEADRFTQARERLMETILPKLVRSASGEVSNETETWKVISPDTTEETIGGAVALETILKFPFETYIIDGQPIAREAVGHLQALQTESPEIYRTLIQAGGIKGMMAAADQRALEYQLVQDGAPVALDAAAKQCSAAGMVLPSSTHLAVWYAHQRLFKPADLAQRNHVFWLAPQTADSESIRFASTYQPGTDIAVAEKFPINTEWLGKYSAQIAMVLPTGETLLNPPTTTEVRGLCVVKTPDTKPMPTWRACRMAQVGFGRKQGESSYKKMLRLTLAGSQSLSEDQIKAALNEKYTAEKNGKQTSVVDTSGIEWLLNTETRNATHRITCSEGQ